MEAQVQSITKKKQRTAIETGSGFEAFQYRDGVLGMQLDVATPLNQIYESENDFKAAVQQVSAYVGSRDAAERWASRLKFLSAGPVDVSEIAGLPEDDRLQAYAFAGDGDNDALGHEDDTMLYNSSNTPTEELSTEEPRCSCESRLLRTLDEDRHQLVRTDPGDLIDCKHYIAVSYCWHSLDRAEYSGPTYQVLCGSGRLRSAKCPQALLKRVVAYAAKEGMRLIWIDQECIDHNDEDDKDLGIQAMDLVYEQAVCSLAVLQACIVEQRHLDALTIVHIDPTGETMCDAELRDLLEALTVIISDPWFERAWTLQESTSAARRMTLLVRYDTALSRPECFAESIAGNIEIPMMWLHTLVSANVQLEVSQRTAEDPRDIRAMGENFMQNWWDVMPADPYDADDGDNDDGQDGDERRFVSNAAQALSYLGIRQNSVIADRLAIMANLCRYEVRLDTRTLNRLGYGFSVCALTLAALNGDFSMAVSAWSARNKANASHPGAQCAHLPPYGFSWLLPADLCLDDVADTDNMDLTVRVRTDRSSLTVGLQVCGRLWVVDRILNVRPVLEMIAARVNYGAKTEATGQINHHDMNGRISHNDGELESVVRQTFCESLVRYLRNQRLDKIADLLSRGLGSERSIVMSDNLQSTSSDQPTRIDELRPYITGQYFVTPEDTLAVARPLADRTGPAAYSGLFRGSIEGDVIFTPDSETLYPAAWKHQNERFPTAWKVSQAEVVSAQCPAYKCHGLIHGNWLAGPDDGSVRVRLSTLR